MTDKSPREIERELERKRADLRGTIDEALDRMTLESAWNYTGKYLRDHRGEYGQTLGSVLKEKPLAVGLVAIGMAWIMFGTSTTSRRTSREENFRRNDWEDDRETRARLAAGDFDDTRAEGPAGSDARPDPWAAPSRTPSPATSAPRGTGTGGVSETPSPAKSSPVAPGGTSSPAKITPTAPGGSPSRSTESLGGSSNTRRSAGESKPAAPAVVPASGPARTGGATSSGSTHESGTRSAGASDTSSGASTTDPKSSKA